MWKLIIIAAFSVIWAFKASEGFDGSINKKKGCDSVINANNSGFELDIHNLSKPCFWDIKPNDSGPISLFFFSLLLHEEDELNIYKDMDDAVNGTNPLTKKPIHAQKGTVTVITNETEIVLMLTGKDTTYFRTFEGFYSVNACAAAVPPSVEILHPPTYLKQLTVAKDCSYRFTELAQSREKQVFTFEEFNMSSSVVKVEGGTFSGEYKNDPPTDFFIDKPVLIVTVTQALNSTDYFRLKIHDVDRSCSGKFNFDELKSSQLKSPQYILNNGSFLPECRWLIESTPSKVLGLEFDKLDFQNVFDLAAINDGLSETSKPLLQVTTSNRNATKNQIIRASGSSLWVAFKPISYKSRFIANITEHEQGGYFKNNGTLKVKPTGGKDTVFLLEVDDNEVVELRFEVSTFSAPATVSVYDGFDTSNLLTSLHGQMNFPVLSRSSRMMVTVTDFSAKLNQFQASFKGVAPSCNHMSSLETENYILTENCNSSCIWIIPPQDSPNSVLIVNLQYISLRVGDIVAVHKLDASLTKLGEIGVGETHVPRFTVPASVGILINVTQGICKEKSDKVVLIGLSSYLPGCGGNITLNASESLQISSPLYPDTYPVFAKCLWNISAPKEAIVHLAFQKFSLAKHHCIKVSQKSTEKNTYEGKTLPPNDLFLIGDVLIDFDSSGCNETKVGNTLDSDLGFVLNVTAADCGAVLNGEKKGEFNTSITGSKAICMWKVSVPPSDGNSVNIISYVVSKDALKNYELTVYDGSTVRDSKIDNNTESEIWSRTNSLIFVYKRLNVSQPSSVLVFKYNTIKCTTLCENKICMHPDWKCNGKDDCGDYSDERDCESVPIPPEVKYTGYSAAAFWLCLIAMTIIGVILGITVPVCYQRYKDSRYRRFHELDG